MKPRIPLRRPLEPDLAAAPKLQAEGSPRFFERPGVARATRMAQRLLLAAIVVYLIFKLSEVGWGAVVDALPVSPWFYALFALRFFALPLTEIPAYELVWRRPLWGHVAAFIRKRVFNFAVGGYSGEAFFTLWARRRLDLTDREILIGVKDNTLLSALASNVATVILVAALAATGGLKAGIDALPGSTYLFLIAFLTALFLSVAVFVFRRKLINLPEGVMPKLLAIHGARVALVMALQAGMYAAALPGASLPAWFMFIALQLVLSRIPFLPNQDLVYLTAALHLSGIVGASEAAIAGMLVAEAGLSQALNFLMFAATAHLARIASPAADARPG